jgi:hypothetical protein
MDKAIVYCVANRAAFLDNVGYRVRRELPKFLLALCGLVFATHLLSRACMGQPAIDISGLSSIETNSGDAVLFAEAKGPFSLGSSALRIPLNPVSPAPVEEGLLASRLEALRGGRSIYVVIKGLHTEVQPGVLYNVYLDLPAGAKPDKDDLHYVGQLNFFNSAYGDSASKSDFFFSYDITAVARKLRARKLLGAQTAITISPAGAPEGGSAPTVGRVELVEQ